MGAFLRRASRPTSVLKLAWYLSIMRVPLIFLAALKAR